ncbi:MAG: hypothetical protein AB7F19_03740 [Candidatus Babeliales bacterium]
MTTFTLQYLNDTLMQFPLTSNSGILSISLVSSVILPIIVVS